MTEIGGKKISELEEKKTLSGTEYIAVVDGSTNKKMKASLFKGLKGDKGETGATGATGPQGKQGIQGETGPAGRGVKSITLTKDDGGVITGGTVTYTDNKTEAITISAATVQ